jgi:hypothetical protein
MDQDTMLVLQSCGWIIRHSDVEEAKLQYKSNPTRENLLLAKQVEGGLLRRLEQELRNLDAVIARVKADPADWWKQ